MLLGFAAGHKAMHEITLVETMAELVEHLFERIDRARERAWFEVYILRDGRFADELECRLAAALGALSGFGPFPGRIVGPVSRSASRM